MVVVEEGEDVKGLETCNKRMKMSLKPCLLHADTNAHLSNQLDELREVQVAIAIHVDIIEKHLRSTKISRFETSSMNFSTR